jgi:hypothetical protein
MKKYLSLIMILASLGSISKTWAAEAYAEVVKAWVYSNGSWRDGYAAFDYNVVYRWPKSSKRAWWDQSTGSARAAWWEMRGSGGLGYTTSDRKYYYRHVTAGVRARVINPLSYGFRPYLYQNQLGQFSREFRIKYSY